MHVQDATSTSDEWAKVKTVAESLLSHLNTPRALARLEAANMPRRNEFATVNRRLAEFFRPGNYTNVLGLCLFGY